MHNISSAPVDIGVDPRTGTDGLTYTAEREGTERESFAQSVMLFIGEREREREMRWPEKE